MASEEWTWFNQAVFKQEELMNIRDIKPFIYWQIILKDWKVIRCWYCWYRAEISGSPGLLDTPSGTPAGPQHRHHWDQISKSGLLIINSIDTPVYLWSNFCTVSYWLWGGMNQLISGWDRGSKLCKYTELYSSIIPPILLSNEMF